MKKAIFILIIFTGLSFRTHEEKKVNVSATTQQWKNCVTTINAAIYVLSICKQDKLSQEEMNQVANGLSAIRNEINIQLKASDSLGKAKKDTTAKKPLK